MEKRGQLFSQPFIMIFAIIVGAIILIWGGKVIYDIVSISGEAQVQLFVDDLKKDIDKQYYYDIGSQQAYIVQLPDKLKQICFYDNAEAINQPVNNQLKQLLSFDLSDNVFLLPLNVYKESRFKLAKLKIKEKNPLCLSNRDQYVLVTGEDFVEIK